MGGWSFPASLRDCAHPLFRPQRRCRLDACGAGGGEETGEGGGGDDPDGGPSQQVPLIAELHGPAEQAVQEIRE